jgi:septal ring factor EnvC (AmiA/AmiB activator)
LYRHKLLLLYQTFTLKKGITTMRNQKFTHYYLVAGLAMATLAGCASDPTAADFMRKDAADANQLAKDWDKGAKQVESGKDDIKEGEERVESAESELTKGQDQIERGNRDISEGNKKMQDSEKTFDEGSPGAGTTTDGE